MNLGHDHDVFPGNVELLESPTQVNLGKTVRVDIGRIERVHASVVTWIYMSSASVPIKEVPTRS